MNILFFVALWILPGAFLLWPFGRPLKFSQILLVLPVSLMISPALLFLAGSVAPLSWINIGCTVLMFGLLTHFLRTFQTSEERLASSFEPDSYAWHEGIWPILLFGLTWLILSYSIPDSRPFPENFDYPKNIALIQSLQGTSLPPANPFFRPGEDIPLTYHYLWHLLAASSAPYVFFPSVPFLLSAFLTGLSLLIAIRACCAVYPSTQRAAPLVPWLVIVLSGFNFVVPWLISFSPRCPNSTPFMTCWLQGPLHLNAGWPDLLQTMTWSPHHFMPLIGALVVPLVVKMLPKALLIFFLPLAFLSMLGSSLFAFVPVAIAGLVFVFSHSQVRSRVLGIFSASSFVGLGLTTALLGAFLWTLGLDRIGSSMWTWALPFQWMIEKVPGTHTWIFLFTLSLAILFLGLLPPIMIFSFSSGRKAWTALPPWIRTLTLTSFACGLFLHSAGPHSDDLSIRSLFIARTLLMIPLAILLLTFMQQGKMFRLILLFALSVPSLFSTFNEGLTFGWNRQGSKAPAHATSQDLQSAFYFLRTHTPEQAILQSPLMELDHSYLFTRRRSAILDIRHGSLFAIPKKDFSFTRREVMSVFYELSHAHSSRTARSLGIDLLLMQCRDIPSEIHQDWEIVYQNDTFAVLRRLR